ncbi:TIGR04197 family type VII secretion effector [Listeria booriae]|uniref:TIGR04197 family type VII secretion effector n=1 Tax=Listeria booriae TaxID=1552123 RepID=A0A7X0Z4E1_9LIST|nr:TIGR04197 family type VII secretion effector [Listeria booriae]MBC1891416.1 TIGR04197 family type VII secretion effector [Listeria booriae]MBC2098438.1 TIGR04197 family type VII secretion effector [Listeria booriae]MBC2175204.1 TIGR04197 family type VII secretion effector [Listeria booriae]
MGEIKLNKEVFDLKLNDIDNSLSTYSAKKLTKITLNQTNLTRIKKYVELVDRFNEQLASYEQLLDRDINKIKNIGMEIVNKDKELSQAFKE